MVGWVYEWRGDGWGLLQRAAPLVRRLWHTAGSELPPEIDAASYTCSMESLTLWIVTCRTSAHAQVLCRELLVVVTYSSSGRHSSG